jgi:hypothetical protein
MFPAWDQSRIPKVGTRNLEHLSILASVKSAFSTLDSNIGVSLPANAKPPGQPLNVRLGRRRHVRRPAASSSGAHTDHGTVRIGGAAADSRTLSRHQPGTVLELALSDRNEDLLRRDADIAVRMVRPRQKSLLARRVGKTAIGFHAHRDYLKRHGIPGTIAEIEARRRMPARRRPSFLRSSRLSTSPTARRH